MCGRKAGATWMMAVCALLYTVAAHAAPVTVTPIGNPIWQPLDFNMVGAQVGTVDNGFADFVTLTGQILPPPNHQPHPQLGVGPGAAHATPYNNELSNGLAALGLADRSTFQTSDYSNDRAVLLSFMVVPNPGTTGSSPDFASGPIIPNSLFPIHVQLANVRDGENFSEPGSFDVPPLDSNLNPPFDVDGHSHFPNFVFDNSEFAIDPSLGPVGNYQYQITMTDTQGSGYNISAPFSVVVPLPAGVWAGLALLAALPVMKKLRRQW